MGRAVFNPADSDHSTPKETLGALVSAIHNGVPCVFRYVKIVDLAVADGDCVMPASTSTWNVTQDIAGGSALFTGHCVGVAVGTITAGNYGYVMVRGIHDNLFVEGTAAAGSSLIGPDAADGRAEVMAAGEEDQVFGVALAADVSNYTQAIINCLG